jgi:hypothetical protein
VSTVYLILGIIGWTAAAILLPAYWLAGRGEARRGIDPLD